MTRQDQMFKWFIYSLYLLPVWVLDAFLLGRWPLLGVHPVLLPVAVAAVAVMEGGTAGAGFGLGTGLLWAMGYPSVGGGMVLFLTLAGLFAGVAAQYVLTQGFSGCLVCAAGVLAALEGLRLGWGLFTQAAPMAILLEVAGKEFLWTLVWTPLIYLLFRLAFRKVGLDRLA